MEPKKKRKRRSKCNKAAISIPKARLRTWSERRKRKSANANEAAFQHLREVIYHKVKMWDASIAAERLLGRDINTAGSIDDFCVGVDDAEDGMKLTESELKDAFELEEPVT